MCKSSQEAKAHEDMEKGKRYGIATARGGLAAFSIFGRNVMECVACAKTGAELTLLNIPSVLQAHYRIGPQEVVTFIQTGHNMQDMVRFKDGREVSLSAFANLNVGVYAGVLEQPEDDLGGDDVIIEPDTMDLGNGLIFNQPAREVVRG